MRNVIGLLVLIFSITSSLNAQEQERRLVDRLLKPDTTLQNNAQNKKFVGKEQSIAKQAAVRSFYISEKPRTKPYMERREVSSKQFAAHHFRDGELASTMQARAQRVRQFSVEDGTGVLVLRDAPNDSRKIAAAEYIGARQFLDKGKSQKAISQHDTQRTTETWREV